jgi:hypothetical protein
MNEQPSRLVFWCIIAAIVVVVSGTVIFWMYGQ